MNQSVSISDVMKYAIQQEIESAELYHGLKEHTNDPRAREIFTQLEEMEIDHRKALEDFNLAAFTQHPEEEYVDFRLTDYMVDVPISKKIDFQQALILAAKREDKTRQLYENMANRMASDVKSRDLFLTLAKEEGRHKHILEDLYDRTIHEKS